MIASGQKQAGNDYTQSTDFGPFPTAVLMTVQVYSAVGTSYGATIQLFKGEQGQDQVMPEINIFPPGVYQYAGAHGFRIKNLVSGQQAYYTAQAWFPNEPIALTQVGSASSTIDPATGQPVPFSPAGSAIEITDGSVDVNPATKLTINPGLTLTSPGVGLAVLAPTAYGAQRELVTSIGTQTILASGASHQFALQHTAGAALLDYTSTVNPKWIAAGTYVVVANIFVDSNGTGTGAMEGQLSITDPFAGGSQVWFAVAPLDTGNGGGYYVPSVAITGVAVAAAGDAWRVRASQNKGIDQQGYFNGEVYRIA